MLKKLLFIGKNCAYFFLISFVFTLEGQTLQTQATQKLQKGHALYKQTKIYDSKSGARESKPKRMPDNAIERMRYEIERLRNPISGKIPQNIKALEMQFSKKIASGNDLKKILSTNTAKSNQFSYWENRGPFNVGGRTRAIAIDRTNENIILAGGVSGGLWRSIDTGKTWRKVTGRDQVPSITTIVQDPRPGRSNTWYYGTGERFGNSASAGGAFFTGNGIFKSTNGGRTWRMLEITNDNTLESISSFDIINSIVIDPTTGDLYVGTIDGIFRSQDEGISFEEVLSSGFLGTCEVAVTTTGKLYATIRSSAEQNPGFFSSEDGTNWSNITPEFLPPTIGRTVMGINPSNENQVYFFAQNVGGGTPAFLLKYDANEATEVSWTDLSSNLPLTIGGPVGNLNLQGGYNMFVKVHPTNPNLVFVAGTNVYRSFDGFTSPVNIDSWVAGYSPLNDVSLYTAQHPDQHDLIFFPSNPDRVLSANDGGVFIAEDITEINTGAEPVEWVSLNNGYTTTQPYQVAFDPQANSDDLVAGFQDNGTWYTNTTDPSAPWVEDFGGDGAFSAIADGGLTRYVSSQRGNVFRLNFDDNGEFISFARIRPEGASNFSFINPFILDPNNDNIMYLPVGNRIWRNNDLDEVPLFSNANATVNWVQLENTDTPLGTTISAVALSTYPIANRLYYGTNNGLIYRMDNANLDNQPVQEIASGKGLPEGFVNNINVDASNPDRVIVSFSNYGIQSLFLTENGGETWINISGNLEENADGTGNGPSVRASAFLGGSIGIGSRIQRVFVATSTGLYYTNRLNGENTRWLKERFSIGNAVAYDISTRKDGFVALAAHGNGLFSARFPVSSNPIPDSELRVVNTLDDLSINQNSEDITIDISNIFEQTSGLPISIALTNTNNELVNTTLQGNSLTLSFAPNSVGEATIGLIASSNGEQVSEGFTARLSEASIYEQTDIATSSVPSQFFVDFGGLAQTADDFSVPSGNRWVIERILAFGGANNAPALTNATVVVYTDNDGTPGEEIYNSGEINPISAPEDSNLSLLLPEPLALEAGNYWLSIYVNLAFNPGAVQWFWSTQPGGINQESYFKDVFDLFGSGATEWTPVSDALDRAPGDQVFQIFGRVQDVNTIINTTSSNQLMTLERLNPLVWPNPSTATFNFNLSSLQGPMMTNKKSMNDRFEVVISDLSGKIIFNESNVSLKNRFEWNAANEAPGFYIVKIMGGSLNKTFKVLKQ